jgi:hypothetical protein
MPCSACWLFSSGYHQRPRPELPPALCAGLHAQACSVNESVYTPCTTVTVCVWAVQCNVHVCETACGSAPGSSCCMTATTLRGACMGAGQCNRAVLALACYVYHHKVSACRARQAHWILVLRLSRAVAGVRVWSLDPECGIMNATASTDVCIW